MRFINLGCVLASLLTEGQQGTETPPKPGAFLVYKMMHLRLTGVRECLSPCFHTVSLDSCSECLIVRAFTLPRARLGSTDVPGKKQERGKAGLVTLTSQCPWLGKQRGSPWISTGVQTPTPQTNPLTEQLGWAGWSVRDLLLCHVGGEWPALCCSLGANAADVRASARCRPVHASIGCPFVEQRLWGCGPRPSTQKPWPQQQGVCGGARLCGPLCRRASGAIWERVRSPLLRREGSLFCGCLSGGAYTLQITTMKGGSWPLGFWRCR